MRKQGCVPGLCGQQNPVEVTEWGPPTPVGLWVTAALAQTSWETRVEALTQLSHSSGIPDPPKLWNNTSLWF